MIYQSNSKDIYINQNNIKHNLIPYLKFVWLLIIATIKNMKKKNEENSKKKFFKNYNLFLF